MGYAKIRPRRGTDTEWSLVNPVIDEGELIMVAPDSGVGTGLTRFKIGDGKTKYQELPWAFDAKASYITGGTVQAYNVISLRGGTTQEWQEYNPILEKYEVVYDSTKVALKIGDGESHFNDLPYCGAEDEILDFGDPDEYDIGDDPDPDPDPTPGGEESGGGSTGTEGSGSSTGGNDTDQGTGSETEGSDTDTDSGNENTDKETESNTEETTDTGENQTGE